MRKNARHVAALLLALLVLRPFATADEAPDSVSRENRLRLAKQQLERARAQRDAANANLAELTQQQGVLESRLNTDGRALYRLSRSGLLPLVSGFDGLIGHASRVERLERIVQTDLRAFTALKSRSGALQAEAENATQSITEAENLVRSEERAQAEHLRRLTEQAASEGRERASASSSSRVSYGLNLAGKNTTKVSFSEQRGKLALPVAGPSSIRDATRVESSGPGLEFLAGRGASVRAVAEGQVAFADRYGSYGELVILDHGHRYYTVYGGFSSLDVQVGDEVSQSARLGTAGVDPIYFEVRRGTRTEAARPWLGL